MVQAFVDGPSVSFCKLCRNCGELVESHVLPKMAYKRFASNPRGGSFVDLADGTKHNRQLKRRWFCNDCEQIFCETEAARWFDNLGEVLQEQYEYGSFLRTFALSLVYRCVLLELEAGTPNQANRRILRKPMQFWRDVLLKKRNSLGPYTVHGFLEATQSVSQWDPSLGGQIAYCHGLAVVRTGPLIVFGTISKPQISAGEASRWSLTEIQAARDRICVVHRDRGHPGVTREMVATLNIVGEYSKNSLIDRQKKSST